MQRSLTEVCFWFSASVYVCGFVCEGVCSVSPRFLTLFLFFMPKIKTNLCSSHPDHKASAITPPSIHRATAAPYCGPSPGPTGVAFGVERPRSSEATRYEHSWVDFAARPSPHSPHIPNVVIPQPGQYSPIFFLDFVSFVCPFPHTFASCLPLVFISL